MEKHEQFMQCAIEQALEAQKQGEVPIGAVIVQNDEIIARGYNQSIKSNDPSTHAEIVAMRAAGLALKNHRLNNCDLYVTLEPCSMCAGAMVHARIRKLYFAASDTKSGAVHSCTHSFAYTFFNHNVEAEGGILADKASKILKDFFKARRNN